MNWIFDMYAKVYDTAMMRELNTARPVHPAEESQERATSLFLRFLGFR